MKTRRGFTLVEALVSIALIIITFTMIAGMFPTLKKGMDLSENRANAALLGRCILNELKSRGFDNIISTSNVQYTFFGIDNTKDRGSTSTYAQTYALKTIYNVDVVYLDDNNAIVAGPTDKKRVGVTIQWDERHVAVRTTKKVKLETVFTRN
jgi:type II secretory pathway pseudopilin PulG